MYLRVLPLPHFSSKVARIPIPSSRLGVPVKTYLYSLLVEQVTMARLCCSDEKWSRSISCRSKSTSNHTHVYACLLNVDFTRRSNVDVLSLSKRITGKRLLDKLNVGSTGRRGWSQSDAVQKLSDRVISHHEDCLVLRRLWPQISRTENFSLDRKKELSRPYVPILHPPLLFRTLRSISVPNTGRVAASTRDKDLGNEFFLFFFLSLDWDSCDAVRCDVFPGRCVRQSVRTIVYYFPLLPVYWYADERDPVPHCRLNEC